MAAPFWRLRSPMATAQAARSLSSLTICSSSWSIFLRQSAMSIDLVPQVDDTGCGWWSCGHLGGDLLRDLVRGVVCAERADEVADSFGGICRGSLFDQRDDGAA